MKFKLRHYLFTLVGLAMLFAPVLAQTYWRIYGTNAKFTKEVWLSGANTISGAATFSGDVSLSDDLILSADTVSLTSPTVTFSAAGKNYVTLNTDTNLTGYYPTGGVLGQVLVIKSGAGTNTMRFDDGTSMSIGGNITLTEGQQDVLALICVSADGDDWARLYNGDN